MRAVIFDMDGVIFDSERILRELWEEYAVKAEFPQIAAAFERCIGLNEAATETLLQEACGAAFDYADFREYTHFRYFERTAGGRLPMKPGVRELLDWLKKNGFRIALASSTATETVAAQLKAAGIYDAFDAVIGGDTVRRSKPDPEIFLKAAAALGADIRECYIIEDSYNGIRAAQAAGAKPIMVPDLLEPDEEIRGACRAVLKDLTEAGGFLEREMTKEKQP